MSRISRLVAALAFAALTLSVTAWPEMARAQTVPPEPGIARTDIVPAQLAQAAGDLLELTVQIPDGPTVRHLGLLLAEERGFFTAAGIAVTLQTASADQSPVAALADGRVDLAIEILPVALRTRAVGANIMHVAQFYQRATLGLACRKEIDQPGKLAGENVGVWLGGWESSFYAWLNRLGLSYFASGTGVTVLRQGVDAELFLTGEVDCMTTTSYLQPLQFATVEGKGQSLVTYAYEDLGLGVLEDGLYARGGDLADPLRVDLFARFLAAAGKGWKFAHDNPVATMKLLAAQPEYAGLDKSALRASVAAANAAVGIDDGLFGRLNATAYDRSINLLLTGAPDPVLAAAPDNAISDAVFKRQRALGAASN